MSSIRFDSHTTDNGLTIVGEYHEHAVSTSMMYVVNAGARDETPEISGVSHFLEHMAFKGNENYSAEDINRLFDELGAEYNAYTRIDATAYYGTVISTRAAEFANLLSQLISPSLREKDFEVEKKVILEEIAMYQDRPDMHLYDMSRALFWNGHGIGNSILGTAQSVSNLTSTQMRDYHKARYSTRNMLFVVTGKYNWDELVAQITELTKEFPNQPIDRVFKDANPITGKQDAIQERLKRMHAMMWYPAPTQTDEPNFTLPLLTNLIGSSENSRLYWELEATGLVEHASLSIDMAPDAGYLYGFIDCDPDDMEKVYDVYRNVLNEVQENGISVEEWEKTKRKFAAAVTMGSETPSGRLHSLAFSYRDYGRYYSSEDRLQLLLRASHADANAFLATKPFDAEFFMTLGPKRPKFS